MLPSTLSFDFSSRICVADLGLLPLCFLFREVYFVPDFFPWIPNE